MYLKGGKKREGGWGGGGGGGVICTLSVSARLPLRASGWAKWMVSPLWMGAWTSCMGDKRQSFTVITVTCTSYTDAGVSDCVVKWLKHTCSFIPRLTHSEIVKKGRAWDHFSCHQNVAGLLPVIRNDWQQASNILHILQPTLCLTFTGAYERREAARRSVKLPYIVCPILCRISRPEFG